MTFQYKIGILFMTFQFFIFGSYHKNIDANDFSIHKAQYIVFTP